jgi:hypothetical protein
MCVQLESVQKCAADVSELCVAGAVASMHASSSGQHACF